MKSSPFRNFSDQHIESTLNAFRAIYKGFDNMSCYKNNPNMNKVRTLDIYEGIVFLQKGHVTTHKAVSPFSSKSYWIKISLGLKEVYHLLKTTNFISVEAIRNHLSCYHLNNCGNVEEISKIWINELDSHFEVISDFFMILIMTSPSLQRGLYAYMSSVCSRQKITSLTRPQYEKY